MKIKALTAISLLLTLGLAVQGQSLQVRSEMKEAMVFFQGAQLSREAQVRVPAGINELVFTQLPLDIDASSIQIKATGPITILSVSHRTNFLESPELSREIRQMEDSLRFYKNRIDLNRAMLKVYEEEETMLAANRSLGGSEVGVKVTELQAAADFLRKRLQEIKTNALKVRQDVDKDEERHTRITQQLSRLRGRSSSRMGEVVVQVSATAAVNSSFTLNYNVFSAGWQPVYDIRVADIDRPLELMLKANAFQNTGEDWNNVKLTFSTGDPHQWGQKPQLSQWFLRFDEEIAVMGYGTRLKIQELNEVMVFDAEMAQAPTTAQSAADIVQVQEGRVTREFIVNTPYNLPSGGDRRVVELESSNLPAQYEYFVVPKHNPDAFLVARVPDWQQYALLPGEANMFFEGTFLGKTFIDPGVTTDTLELSLGRDRNIVVKRERMKDQSRRSFLGNRTTETVGWEISARNNKRVAIILNIQDQVPLSTQQDIEVNVEETSGAAFDKDRGFLTWRMELKPGENQTRILRYSVRYPRNKKITLE
jgi:uncharacterized protein (TIGR02231 family)